MLKNLTTQNGLYLSAVLVGIVIFLIDSIVFNLTALMFPTFSAWAGELFLLIAVVGLGAYAWIKFSAKVQIVALVFLVFVGYNLITASLIFVTMDTFKAKVTTAGLDESQKGKKAVWRASVKPEGSEKSTLYRAQDAMYIWPIIWYSRSADTRVKLEEAKNEQKAVCIKAYGIRFGLFSAFPNVVKVSPESKCD